MSVKYKDYYKLLGVERTASQDEIRKAFRKLAAKYHPDRHQGDKAMEEKFKEVNEAYEVLRDPTKRQRYDALGANWKQGQQFDPNAFNNIFGGRATTGRTGGFGGAQTFRMETGPGGFSEFFEALFGGMGVGGMGSGRGGGVEDLFARFEEGHARRGGAEEFGGGGRPSVNVEASITISLEEAYKGGVRTISFRRTEPNGQASTQGYEIRIPPGIRDGQKLRLKGQGSVAGAAAGDILIVVKVRPHPRFTLEGNDLITALPLAPWEAVLGARIEVPTLDGSVEVKVPAGMQSGKRMRVKGAGWPGKGGQKGDLYLRVTIQVPENPGAQEKELYERLGRVSRFDPRK